MRSASPAPTGSAADTSARSSDRYRRATFTAVGMMGARAVASITAIITVPLTLNYLGVERYGLWMTISSFIALLTFADLGLGNGLLTLVSRSYGHGDQRSAAKNTASAVWMLAAVGALLVLVFAVAYHQIDWPGLFNLRTAAARREAGPSVAIFAALLAIGLPFNAAYHLRNAFQEGYAASLYVAAGNLVGFLAVVLCVVLRLSLPSLVLAMMGGPILASMANFVAVIRRRPWLVPRWSNVDRQTSLGLLRSGSQYLMLQLTSAAAFATQSIIAAQVLGARSVADYAVASKLFLVPSVMITAALYSLWPAYSEAVSSGDVRWVIQTLRRSIWLTLVLTIPLCVGITIASDLIFAVWIGDAVKPPMLLIVAMALLTIINGLGTAQSMLLNALHALKAQIMSGVVMAVASVALSIFLAARIGIAGVVWGSVVAFLVFTLIPMGLYVGTLLRQLQPGTATEASTSGAGSQ